MSGVLVLYYTGSTLNTMILAGFVLAIGDCGRGRCDHRRREHRAPVAPTSQSRRHASTARINLEASLEVRQAIIHATLIDVVVLIPIFFIGGLSGAFFQPLAVSYGLAVMASSSSRLRSLRRLC